MIAGNDLAYATENVKGFFSEMWESILLQRGWLLQNGLQVFELMRKQEETRQAEESSRKAEYQALQAQHETVCTPLLLHIVLSLCFWLLFPVSPFFSCFLLWTEVWKSKVILLGPSPVTHDCSGEHYMAWKFISMLSLVRRCVGNLVVPDISAFSSFMYVNKDYISSGIYPKSLCELNCSLLQVLGVSSIPRFRRLKPLAFCAS